LAGAAAPDLGTRNDAAENLQHMAANLDDVGAAFCAQHALGQQDHAAAGALLTGLAAILMPEGEPAEA
jgi:hypothetical protein